MTDAPAKLDRNGVKGIVLVFGILVIHFAVLLLLAGRIDWINAWIYFITFSLLHLVYSLLFLKINPGLLNERGKMIRENTKPFDRVFFIVWRVLSVVAMAIAGLDAGRFRWSHMPVSLVAAGVLVTFPSFALALWAMAVNTHFESTVRIQSDRGHRVCDEGPYRFVRHPGYVGMIVSSFSMPLILGSWLGLVPCGVIAILIIVRTALEDRMLAEELPGYREYTGRTRYRLLPLVW